MRESEKLNEVTEQIIGAAISGENYESRNDSNS
jgi:hypothetical protein